MKPLDVFLSVPEIIKMDDEDLLITYANLIHYPSTDGYERCVVDRAKSFCYCEILCRMAERKDI